MPEHDALVGSYQHLQDLPRSAEALHILRKISSLVKPIMRKRNWRVGTLKEFFPDQNNLLGLNVDRGRSICLRLRHAGDKGQFILLENVIDTMLHELSHNVHGPHDEKFHALWNELRDEYIDLKMKGYSGEGFLSDGHRLGGRHIPMHELRRNARAEAEKRKALQLLQRGSGQKVGGAPVLRGTDMRNVIADAVTRRVTITKGCASGTSGADQVSRDADRNGFRTKAEEDDANDRAIAQALWELVQEEEANKAGVEPQRTTMPKFPSTAKASQQSKPRDRLQTSGTKASRPRSASPSRRGALGQLDLSRASKGGHLSSAARSFAAKPTAYRQPPRLISEDESRRRNATVVDLTPHDDVAHRPSLTLSSSSSSNSSHPLGSKTWSCPLCTLVNPMDFLMCDACGVERPSTISFDAVPVGEPKRLTSSPSFETKSRGESLGWNCLNCGSFHEHKWWTCTQCGMMKSSSSA